MKKLNLLVVFALAPMMCSATAEAQNEDHAHADSTYVAQSVDCSGCESVLADSCSTNACNSGCRKQGAYFSVFGGFGNVEDYDFVGPATFQGSFSNRFGIGAAIGRRLSDSLRGEVEYVFRGVEGEDWIVNGNPGTWSGDLDNSSIMANLIYELNFCSRLGLRPYVGTGIGASIIDGDLTTAVGTLNIDESNFSWQAIAGASRKINQRCELFAEYRYQDAGEVDIINGAGASIGSEDVRSHFGFFGIRIYR